MVSIPRHQRNVIDDLTTLMDKAVKFQYISNPHKSLGVLPLTMEPKINSLPRKQLLKWLN